MRLLAAVALMVSLNVQAHGLPNFTELANNNQPAVVNISTTRKATESVHPFSRKHELPEDFGGGQLEDFLKRFFGAPPGGRGWSQPESRSLGSGFIVSSDGYIITNHHVIAEADEIIVRLSDASELVAELIGSDKRSDIALLKIDKKNLPTLKWGNSAKLQVGEWVLAIGSPFGFDYSVTAGIVSAKQRSLPSDAYVPFIQTDVAINPGNSGGPLLNLKGEVVGVNSQIFSGTGGYMGLSFAVPADLVQNVVDQLKDKGYVARGWLGVGIQSLTRELAESFKMDKAKGALVTEVLKDSPAEKAGIEPGDVILEFNGEEIDGHANLPPKVGKFPIGQSARVKILRNGKNKVISVKIGELPAEELLSSRRGGTKKSPGSSDRLGLVLKEVDKATRDKLKLAKGGVVVAQVSPGPAAKAGIRVGDAITSVNQDPVQDVEDYLQAIETLKPGSSVALLVQRSSGSSYIAVRLPKDDK